MNCCDMEKLVDFEVTEIVRIDSEWENMRVDGYARLCANYAEYCYFNFPENWTDKQIELALRFANMAYSQGVKYGAQQKTRQIKEVLNIEI